MNVSTIARRVAIRPPVPRGDQVSAAKDRAGLKQEVAGVLGERGWKRLDRRLVVGDSHPNHQTLTKYFTGNVVAKAMIHDQH